MEITIDLPEQTIRKIKALSVLRGGAASDIEPLLVEIVDTALTLSIAGELGLQQEGPVTPSLPVVEERLPRARQTPRLETARPKDYSGITAGLGDEEPHDDDETPENEEHDPMALIKPAGARGVRDEELERDLDVDDAEHEAKNVATAQAPEG